MDDRPVSRVSPAPPGRVGLIRHAETAWSREGRHTGRTDIPLTPEGERQAALLAAALTGHHFVLVATSPRIRAVRTADLAGLVPSRPGGPAAASGGGMGAGGGGRPASPPAPAPALVDRREIWPELAEWDYGDYEGLTTQRIREDVPGWTVWTGPVPGGESAEQVGARADTVLARLEPILDSGDVALVGHAHMLRVLIARWLGLAPTAGACFVLDPAGWSELGREHGTRALLRLNVGVEGAVALRKAGPGPR